MDLGLAPHTVMIMAVMTLVGIAAFLVAYRQEQADRRAADRVAAEVGGMELPEIRQLLRQALVTPNRQFWQVIEEGLVRFRPRDRHEELQRQRLLQDVRLRLLP